MGKGMQNLKLYGVAMVAVFLIMAVLGAFGPVGGPLSFLGGVFGFLFDHPRIIAVVGIVIVTIYIGDRIAG